MSFDNATEPQRKMLFAITRALAPYMSAEESEQYTEIADRKDLKKSIASYYLDILKEKEKEVKEDITAGYIKEVKVIRPEYGVTCAMAQYLLQQMKTLFDDKDYARLTREKALTYNETIDLIERIEEESDIKIADFDEYIKNTHYGERQKNTLYKTFLFIKSMVELAEVRHAEEENYATKTVTFTSHDDSRVSFEIIEEESREDFTIEAEAERALSHQPAYVSDYKNIGYRKPKDFDILMHISRIQMKNIKADVSTLIETLEDTVTPFCTQIKNAEQYANELFERQYAL